MGVTTAERESYDAASRTEQIRLNSLAFAEAAAVVSAGVMLLLGIFGTIGIYEGAVRMMEQWHLFFEPTILGTAGGMVEAAVISFVLTYALIGLYNLFAR